MTSEEFDEILERTNAVICNREWYEKAIKALSAEPCEDCISREYILSKAHCCCDDLADDEPCCVDVDDIKKAPSIQPKAKVGHWISRKLGKEIFFDCSECNKLNYKSSKFCPNCGADMRESEEV